MSAEEEVLAANQAFYVAFASSDMEGMEDVWALEHAVVCIHPGWEVIYGRNAVLGSFRAILSAAESPKIRATAERAFVLGRTAFVTCIERVGAAELAATNVFTREHGIWKMVHHHASPIAPEHSEHPPPNKNDLN